MTDKPELFDSPATPSEEETGDNPVREVHIILSSPGQGMLRLSTATYGYEPNGEVDEVLMLAVGLVDIMLKPEFSMLRSMIPVSYTHLTLPTTPYV